MLGCYIYVWLFLFDVFAKENLEVKTGLYSHTELPGMSLHQKETVASVSWAKLKLNKSQMCITYINNGTGPKCYSDCCKEAQYNFTNNTFILKNMTAQDEGVFMETIIRRNGTMQSRNYTLIIQYPPKATEIVVSHTSNTSVTLKCEVSGSFLQLMWRRERVPILEKHRHSFSERNQTLHISNITSSDYGTYSCCASNAYGESEQHINITGENSPVNQGNGSSGKITSGQILLSSGLTLMGVLGLCIMFYGLYKYHHRQRVENGRTDEGDADNGLGIYQEVPDTVEFTPLPYVYTDFIKPKEPNQASAGAQHFEDFGYSEVGPTCSAEFADTVAQYCDEEQTTACPEAEDE